ncbi:collagen alpha-1(I) chain-like [Trachypithecus francoisi]|uniref:collagen alpha-1(I) chain-like n=1 Tax=Trachypithecus francoisi TaxID=54180 RepID=UPI00141B2BF1|nr:collagen alpha-1(I) chain-like [Trachypithecus francoisi]
MFVWKSALLEFTARLLKPRGVEEGSISPPGDGNWFCPGLGGSLPFRSCLSFRCLRVSNHSEDPAHCFPESCPDKPHVGWLLAGPLGLNPKGQQGHAPADGGPRRASPGAAWAQCGASAGQGRGGKSSPAQPASGVKQVIPLRPAGAGASLLPAGFHLRKQHWGRSRAVGTGPGSPGRRSRPGSPRERLRPPGAPARALRPLATHLPPTPHSPARTVPAASPARPAALPQPAPWHGAAAPCPPASAQRRRRASGRGASGWEPRTAGARGAGGPAAVPSSSPPRASAFTSGSGDARPATRLCLSPAHGPEVQLRTGQWTQSWGPGGSRPPDASGPGWPRSRRRARTLAGKHRRTLTRHTLAPACPRRRVETDVGFAQELEAREGSEPEPCNSPRSANTRLPLLKASRSLPTTHICHWRGRRRPRPRSSIAGQTELPVRAPELPEKLTWAQVKIAAVAQKWPGSSKEKRNRLLPKGEEFDSRGCCLPRFPLSLAPQKRLEGDRPDAGGQRASREPTSSCRKHSRVAC